MSLSSTPSPPPPRKTPIIAVRSISKSFHGVPAIQDMHLELMPGEIHAVLGENGAGKSTLMKILSGVYPADAGEIFFEGAVVQFKSPKDAQQYGIITIYQEFNLIPALSIAENIFLGHEPCKTGILDWHTMNQQAQRLLQKVGLNLNPSQAVNTLGVGEQQMVEIAKALHHDARVVIMDEPTAALSLTETHELFRVVRELKSQGITIVFISHHLDEVFDMADRATVMRDGQYIGRVVISQSHPNEVIRMMVGRTIDNQFPKEIHNTTTDVLVVRGLTRKDHKVHNINLRVRAGEVLGIGGLMGSGRTELLRAIFGADPISSGTITLNGQTLKIGSPTRAVQAGIGFLTEDRKQQGLVMTMGVRENLTLGVLDRLSQKNPLTHTAEQHITRHYIQELGIRAASTEQNIAGLSGGNQQKVLLSRWLALKPKVLLLDEPTRGVDVGAKVEIYRLINQMAATGMAIIMVSSDLPELLGMSDTLIVLHDGKVSGALTRPQFSQVAFMQLAAGVEGEMA